ncbi:hypothetical protein FRC12_010622 [Ceratobasidium sp. 428]|nr:hypothetical protein FRC12_010622 [Ceratobasidium sp. 428]
MLVAESLAWYNHVYDGQTGKLQTSTVFQFSTVTKHDGTVIEEYDLFCTRRHPSATLTWSPQAIVYSRHVEESHAAGPSHTIWQGLPVARMIGCHSAFTETECALLSGPLTNQMDLAGLASLACEVEALGPSHVADSSRGSNSAHLPSNQAESNLSVLLNNVWPPVAVFDAEAEDHLKFSFTTLVHWLKSTTLFRHAESGTLVVGPSGVPWAIALLFVLTRAMVLLDQREDVPLAVQAAFTVESHAN